MEDYCKKQCYFAKKQVGNTQQLVDCTHTGLYNHICELILLYVEQKVRNEDMREWEYVRADRRRVST